MPVVARPGQALGGNQALLAARPGLNRVEQREADRLLELGIAVELDVGLGPVPVEVRALLAHQLLPTGMARTDDRRGDLVAHRRHRSLARPPVAYELHEP